MNEKTSKSGMTATCVIFFVLLVLLNVFTFAVPFPKTSLAVHYIAFSCAEFLILAVCCLILMEVFAEKTKNQRVMSLPIIYFAFVLLAVQVVATILFYILNAFLTIPVWIIVLTECLIYGVGIIRIAVGFFFKDRNEEYHKNLADTSFMDEFRAKLKTLEKQNQNKNLEKALSDLVDTALASDPVTNEKTVESEKELSNLLSDLEAKMNKGSENEQLASIQKTKEALLKRNELCKLGK